MLLAYKGIPYEKQVVEGPLWAIRKQSGQAGEMNQLPIVKDGTGLLK